MHKDIKFCKISLFFILGNFLRMGYIIQNSSGELLEGWLAGASLE